VVLEVDNADYHAYANVNIQTHEVLMMNRVSNAFQYYKEHQTSILLWGAFGCILFGTKLWLISTYGNATPFWDQWNAEAELLYSPYLNGTLEWESLFSPHNEHRIFATRVLSLFLLIINNIWNPLLQMVVNALLHVFTIVLGIYLLLKVVGRNHQFTVAIFSAVLFGVPYAWENTLAGFQSQFYFVLLFSLVSLWLIVARPPFSTRWWQGVFCAVLAYFSLASGIFAVAAAVVANFFAFRKTDGNSIKHYASILLLAGLFLTGFWFTPTLEYHAALKAESFGHFANALVDVLSWPLPPSYISCVVRNAPAVIFLLLMLWKRPTADDSKWYLFALIVWSIGQAASIAYGRANGHMASRYLDLFAIAILINYVSLISINQLFLKHKRINWHIMLQNLWVGIVIIFLGIYASSIIPGQLSEKQTINLAQEDNLADYLTTLDAAHLENKQFLHIPYPDPDQLISILHLPWIKDILPSNIRPPIRNTSVNIEPVNSFVNNGYYQTTPELAGMTLGSFNGDGDYSTGQARLDYHSDTPSHYSIPVAGYPLNQGIKLEVIQNNTDKPVKIDFDPGENWTKGYFSVDKGAFSILLTDSNNGYAGWLAIGEPLVVGRLDDFVELLLTHCSLLIFIGMLMVLLFLSRPEYEH